MSCGQPRACVQHQPGSGLQHQLLAALKDECIDCVFADPPFNLAKDYGNGGDKDDLGRREYLDWCRSWVTECVRVLKPGGALFTYNLPRNAFRLAAYLEDRGMSFRHWIAVSMKGSFKDFARLFGTC
jgi:site-specific DNA-methyltransferase (adenine-specific)